MMTVVRQNEQARGTPRDHTPGKPHDTPASLSQRPLEPAATRVLNSSIRRLPLAPAQVDELIDEQSSLLQRITLLELALEEARQFANYDHLTGVPNRRLLQDRFEQAKARSDRQRKSLAVLFLDIDGFKHVNDTHGHVVGDDLLRRIAARLIDCIRTSDTVCRYGGDEFVILLPELDGWPSAIATARKIREQLAAPYFTGTASMNLTASLGMALYPDDGIGLSKLIEEADSAMYVEKTSTRDEPYVPPRFRADKSGKGIDGKAVRFARTGTRSKRESACSLEEDAFTNEGAPPPTASAPHIDLTARNS